MAKMTTIKTLQGIFKTKDTQDFTITKKREFHELLSFFHTSNNFYLYRGHRDVNFDLNSSWLRYHAIDKNKIHQDKYQEDVQILRSNIEVFDEYIKRIQLNPKYKNMDALTILATLQHSKDVPTPLIDFTDDLLLAFWFALNEYKWNTNAAIFIIEAKVSQIRKHMKDFDQNSISYIFESPVVSGRVLSQRSYFVVDFKDWQKSKNVIRIIIHEKIIDYIMEFLKDKNKSNTSIFPDLKGEYLNASTNFIFPLLLNGYRANKLGKYEEAIKFYNKYISKHPNYADVYIHKSISQVELKEYKKALLNLNKAIKLNPNSFMAYYNRAIIRREFKNTKGVLKDLILKDLNTTIELNPNLFFAYIYRGEILMQLGDKKRALLDLGQAIKFKINSAYEYSNKGRAEFFLGHTKESINSYSKAIDLYKNKIKLNPNLINELSPQLGVTYYNRGLALKKLDKNDEALLDFQEAIKLGVPVPNDIFKEINNKK